MPNRPIRFLIADDDLLILDQLTHIIESLNGIVVAKVSDGNQAIAAFIEQQPDIVILDVVMPQLDGFAAYRKIRKLNSRQEVAYIFISANYSSECVGLELGAHEFLSKPLDTHVALIRLRNQILLLQSKRALQAPVQALQEEREQLTEIVSKMRRVRSFDPRNIHFTESPSERSEGNTLLSTFDAEQNQYILVGNFSSYGIPAALSGALITYLFYQLTLDKLTLAEILQEINQVLFEQFPPQLFMAACAISISANREHADIWNFGMHPAALLNQQHELKTLQPSGDLPLGIAAQANCRQAHSCIQLQAGDQFYLFSKAINTIPSKQARQYNTSKLADLLSDIRKKNQPLDSIWSQLTEFSKQYNWSDDAVLVAISA